MFLEKTDLKIYDFLLISPSEGPFVDEVKKLGIKTHIIPKDPEIKGSNLQPSPFKISRKIFSKFAYRLKYFVNLFKLLRDYKPDVVYLRKMPMNAPPLAVGSFTKNSQNLKTTVEM